MNVQGEGYSRNTIDIYVFITEQKYRIENKSLNSRRKFVFKIFLPAKKLFENI
jgi:hypothetical protein